MAVYKRGNIWWVRFQRDGIEVRRSSESQSKAKALALEKKLKAQKPQPRANTYGQALLKWAQTAPDGMKRPAKYTTHLADVPLTRLVPEAHRMRDDLHLKGLAPATINRRLAVIRRVLNVAYREWDWIDQPLGQKIKLLSEKGTERHVYLTRDEVTALVDAMKLPAAKNVTLLAAFTGLRKGEILALEPENWRQPYIVLGVENKAKRPRSVPVVPELHGALDALPFDISESMLRRRWEAARKAVGKPGLRFHDLRHTFASWIASDPDVPLTVLRDVLGHSNLSVTSRYAHLKPGTADLITGALVPRHSKRVSGD